MPQDFRCQQCALQFSLGSYHYGHIPDGYFGRRLMVCTSCGTQHGLEIALRSRGPEFYEMQKVVVAQVPSPVPQALVAWIRRSKSGLSLADTLALARCPPFVLNERTGKEQASRICDELARWNVIARAEDIGRERNPNFGPLRKHRLLAADAPSETDRHHSSMNRMQELEIAHDYADSDLRMLGCLHCSAQGTLVSDTGSDDDFSSEDETMPCPRCKASALVVESSWIT